MGGETVARTVAPFIGDDDRIRIYLALAELAEIGGVSLADGAAVLAKTYESRGLPGVAKATQAFGEAARAMESDRGPLAAAAQAAFHGLSPEEEALFSVTPHGDCGDFLPRLLRAAASLAALRDGGKPAKD